MTTASTGRVSTALESGLVSLAFRARDTEEAIRRLVLPLFDGTSGAQQKGPAAVDAILARERSGSTALGRVAIPHGRLSGVGRIFAALALNPQGTVEGADISVMLAFVSPSEAAAEHLRFLSAAAQLLRDDDTVEAMLHAATAEAVLDIVRRRER
jgi:mannitol/fructose-specific phosphotransferase system IIA component (Ntr-type)